MTYSLTNNCTKSYYNRTLTVQVIVEDVVTWIFLRHSVEVEKYTIFFQSLTNTQFYIAIIAKVKINTLAVTCSLWEY